MRTTGAHRGIEWADHAADCVEVRIATRSAPVFLLVWLTMVAACSSGSTGGSAPDYARRAQAICAGALESIPPTLTAVRTVSARSRDRLALRLNRARGRAIERLRSLAPPSDVAARVRRMLQSFERSQMLLRRADRRTGESETVLPILLTAAGEDDAKARALAGSLGLSDCARL